MKLKEQCPECGKSKALHCEHSFEQLDPIFGLDKLVTYKTYKCFHTERFERPLNVKPDYSTLDYSKQAYTFQEQGIQFIINSDFNCLIADAMGLGKTIQALLAARARPDLKPILVIVKSATTFQWLRESKEWYSDSQLSCFPIIGTKSFLPPGFDIYLISMDTLGRKGMWEKLLPLKIKLIIADESHSFKEPDAARTKALINLIKTGEIKHKVFLSGTPIKNRASEYFTVLNLLAPDYFPTQDGFRRKWLLPETKGRITVYNRLNPARIEQFRELTSRWVLRREKHEVLKDLPKFTRNWQLVSIEDPAIKNSYNKQLDLMQNMMLRGELKDSFSILGELAKLRRITGQAKVPLCAEYVQEFLESTEQEFKIAIGIHHESVRDSLFYALQEYKPLKLSGEDNAIRKDQIVQQFKGSDRRLLIINELAGGVGLNLQCCANTLILERQWNAADEEQFESRFHRNGQTLPVVADYLIATGTIDEWFHAMVEEKRKIFGETVSNWQFTNDSTGIRQLFDQSVGNRL